jgi:TRAP-type C4-dicarboxylate transport system permease small subunit
LGVFLQIHLVALPCLQAKTACLCCLTTALMLFILGWQNIANNASIANFLQLPLSPLQFGGNRVLIFVVIKNVSRFSNIPYVFLYFDEVLNVE